MNEGMDLVLNLGFHVLTTLKPYWAWICSFANPGKCGGAHLWLQSSRGGSRRIVAPRPVGSWSALARVRMCLSPHRVQPFYDLLWVVSTCRTGHAESRPLPGWVGTSVGLWGGHGLHESPGVCRDGKSLKNSHVMFLHALLNPRCFVSCSREVWGKASRVSSD